MQNYKCILASLNNTEQLSTVKVSRSANGIVLSLVLHKVMAVVHTRTVKIILRSC